MCTYGKGFSLINWGVHDHNDTRSDGGGVITKWIIERRCGIYGAQRDVLVVYRVEASVQSVYGVVNTQAVVVVYMAIVSKTNITVCGVKRMGS